MHDDRGSNVGGEHTGAGAAREDHQSERDPRLSARSLAARGDAPDGSQDGAAASQEQADGSGKA